MFKLLPSEQMLVVDPYFSPYAGGANLLVVDDYLISWRESLNPLKYSDVVSRTLEQFFLWSPVGVLTATTQHEVFGHGYRLRSLGVTPISYRITGRGGSTYFSVPWNFEVGKLISVAVAGLEAESILAWELKMKWIKKRKIDGRESTLYITTQQSLFTYTMRTYLSPFILSGPPGGNDIHHYLLLHRALFPNQELSLSTLSKWAALSLLDPMTYYSWYAYFSFMIKDKPSGVPMISLAKDLDYLPNLKVGFAPYAPEVYFENFFLNKDHPIYFYLKGGRRSYGFGGVYDELLAGSYGHLGIKIDLWNQGNFISSLTLEDLEHERYRPFGTLPETPRQRKFGGALSLRAFMRFGEDKALFVEVGGKTSGYLPGYSLGKGPVFRIGLKFGLSPIQKEE